MKIEIEIDAYQLEIIMMNIEGMFAHSGERSLQGMSKEVEHVALNSGIKEDSTEFAFEILTIAPLYAQLLEHCERMGALDRGCREFDDIFEFTRAVRAARTALGEPVERSS